MQQPTWQQRLQPPGCAQQSVCDVWNPVGLARGVAATSTGAVITVGYAIATGAAILVLCRVGSSKLCSRAMFC